MNRIELVLPSENFKEQVLEYKKEFEISGDSMDGTANLRHSISYEEWLNAIKDNLKEDTVRDGLVPASTYLAIRASDHKLIGMIDIRHRLNDYLLQFGGHIGYSVRKSERNKGYAREMLKLALEKCKAISLDKVLITCDKENIASSKTIIGNGGILENEVQDEERITQRFWVTIN